MNIGTVLAHIALVVTAPLADESWEAPVSPTVVVRDFDYLEFNWQPGHRGVDLATSPGQEVYAANAGRVVYSGWLVDRPVVSVEHWGGLRSTYLPVDPVVDEGQWVMRGDLLGTVDGTHCLTACLHWGIKRGDRYYDPMVLLDGLEVRLYPRSGPF